VLSIWSLIPAGGLAMASRACLMIPNSLSKRFVSVLETVGRKIYGRRGSLLFVESAKNAPVTLTDLRCFNFSPNNFKVMTGLNPVLYLSRSLKRVVFGAPRSAMLSKINVLKENFNLKMLTCV
jgi:hypothetical protein